MAFASVNAVHRCVHWLRTWVFIGAHHTLRLRSGLGGGRLLPDRDQVERGNSLLLRARKVDEHLQRVDIARLLTRKVAGQVPGQLPTRHSGELAHAFDP